MTLQSLSTTSSPRRSPLPGVAVVVLAYFVTRDQGRFASGTADIAEAMPLMDHCGRRE
jgi:hypothetical protein